MTLGCHKPHWKEFISRVNRDLPRHFLHLTVFADKYRVLAPEFESFFINNLTEGTFILPCLFKRVFKKEYDCEPLFRCVFHCILKICCIVWVRLKSLESFKVCGTQSRSICRSWFNHPLCVLSFLFLFSFKEISYNSNMNFDLVHHFFCCFFRRSHDYLTLYLLLDRALQ